MNPKTPLRTDEDVALFTAALGAPILGTKVNCEQKDHTSPFRVVADVITGRVEDYIAWANRSGSKTYSIGGFCTWYKSSILNRFQTTILGGSEAQSKLSYEAMNDFFRLTETEKTLLKPPGLKKTSADWLNGSSVSILTASTKSVRGPHTQCLLLDEVDEMDEEVYESALSIPQEKYDIPSSLGMFSTNHNVEGLMDKAVQHAEENDIKVYKYCVWECLESCKDYECSTCKLSRWCPGKQMKQADGYYKIRDFIKKLGRISEDMLSRDWFCLKIGHGDTVYLNEYKKDLHLVSIPLRDAPVELSLDWGGADPFSAGVWQKIADTHEYGEDSWVRVAELYLPSVDKSVHNGIFIKEARKKPWWKYIRVVVCDSSRPDLIQQWKEALPDSVKFVLSDKKSIDDGIEVVKSVLAPADGPPHIYINRTCRDWIREVKMYRRKKITDTDWIIVDKNNHAMDETRYWVKYKFALPASSYFGLIKSDISPK